MKHQTKTKLVVILAIITIIAALLWSYHFQLGAAYERGRQECEHRVDTVYDTVIIYADSAYMDGYIDGVWDAFASQYNLPCTFDTLTVRR